MVLDALSTKAVVWILFMAEARIVLKGQTRLAVAQRGEDQSACACLLLRERF